MTTTSDRVLARLQRLHPKKIDLSLGRMERLLEKLGHPEDKLPPVIHVAGTNGKGSTVAYLRAILEAANLRVHVYSSPHLVRFAERIRLAGKIIDEGRLLNNLIACEKINGDTPITYFEITTAVALMAFAQSPADILLMEVGLGGRYDATNVIPTPAATIITHIGYDHQHFLGETLGEIAGEKAGILKRDVPAIVSQQSKDVLERIKREALQAHAPLYLGGQDWTAYEEHGRFVYQDTDGLLDLPMPGLIGAHQLENAGAAIAALRQVEGFALSGEAVAKGLTDVHWPARMQRLKSGPLVDVAGSNAELWLDGCHNPSGGQAAAAALADLDEQHPLPLYLICAMQNTKEAVRFFENFRGLARQVFTFTVPDVEAAIAATDLATMAGTAGLEAMPMTSLRAAVGRAVGHADAETGEPPRILICGTLYLAGHILREHK
ncbi:MAG: bifunctional folylpolyglutamate synthase/dihydrofolate synthase [Emcibacter sp.]|nr:bifunctional folylpolyglutamate synthase/dihydrofolate synthase [Emcibacter sp.]